MDAMVEKRTSTRKNLHRVVTFEMSSKEKGCLKNIRESGQGMDISSGGLGLITKQALTTGSILRLFLPVVPGGPELPVFSEVVWVKRAGSHMETGLRFL